jgi:hypothetical protein
MCGGQVVDGRRGSVRVDHGPRKAADWERAAEESYRFAKDEESYRFAKDQVRCAARCSRILWGHSTAIDEFDAVLDLYGCERPKRTTCRLLQPFPKHRDESPPCYQAEPLGAFLAVPEFHAPVFLVRWVLPQSAETMGHVAMQVRYGFDQFGQKW